MPILLAALPASGGDPGGDRSAAPGPGAAGPGRRCAGWRLPARRGLAREYPAGAAGTRRRPSRCAPGMPGRRCSSAGRHAGRCRTRYPGAGTTRWRPPDGGVAPRVSPPPPRRPPPVRLTSRPGRRQPPLRGADSRSRVESGHAARCHERFLPDGEADAFGQRTGRLGENSVQQPPVYAGHRRCACPAAMVEVPQ